MVNSPCRRVSSFGSLSYFTKENRPPNANSDRCLSCAAEPGCVYSAKKIYLDNGISSGVTGWPVHVVAEEPSVDSVTEALKTGPYGLCVFGATGNDVVDNQVVNLEFQNGTTCNFLMVAFSEEICVRKTRLFGTHGEIVGDGRRVHVFDFRTQTGKDYVPHAEQAQPPRSRMRGHDFGDYHLMRSFVDAVASGDPSKIQSGPRETLESHLIVFAAERARKTSQVVELHV